MLEKCLQYYLKVIKIMKLNFYHQTKQKIYKKKLHPTKKLIKHKIKNYCIKTALST